MPEFPMDQVREARDSAQWFADWEKVMASKDYAAVRKKVRQAIQSGEYKNLPTDLQKEVSDFLSEYRRFVEEIPESETAGKYLVFVDSRQGEPAPANMLRAEGELENGEIKLGKSIICGGMELPPVAAIYKGQKRYNIKTTNGVIYQLSIDEPIVLDLGADIFSGKEENIPEISNDKVNGEDTNKD